MWRPRPPEVLGQPTAPSSSSTSRTTWATRRTRAGGQSGIGARSLRHSSGRSTWPRRELQGSYWTVDIWTAQITCAISVTRSSSACRPLRGKRSRTVSTQGGAPRGTRFWWTFSPSTPVGKRCSMQGRSRSAATMPGPTARWYRTRSSFVAPRAGKWTRSGLVTRTVRPPTSTSVAGAVATGPTVPVATRPGAPSLPAGRGGDGDERRDHHEQDGEQRCQEPQVAVVADAGQGQAAHDDRGGRGEQV